MKATQEIADRAIEGVGNLEKRRDPNWRAYTAWLQRHYEEQKEALVTNPSPQFAGECRELRNTLQFITRTRENAFRNSGSGLTTTPPGNGKTRGIP